MRLSRLLMRIAIVSLVAIVLMLVGMGTGFGAGMLAFFRADWLILVGALLVGYGLLGSEVAHALEHARKPILMQSALVAALLSLTGAMVILFYGFRLPPQMLIVLSKILGTLTMWLAWCALLGLLTRVRTSALAARIAIWTALGPAAATLAAGAWGMWANHFTWPPQNDPLAMGVLAGLVLSLIASIASLFMSRLKQLDGTEAAPIPRHAFRAWCPRCMRETNVHTGGAACDGCGLKINVVIP